MYYPIEHFEDRSPPDVWLRWHGDELTTGAFAESGENLVEIRYDPVYEQWLVTHVEEDLDTQELKVWQQRYDDRDRAFRRAADACGVDVHLW